MLPAADHAGLAAAKARSFSAWQADLRDLFHSARDRFPDVVWEMGAEGSPRGERVWGHKALIYARAPAAFQGRYFSMAPRSITTPTPYFSAPLSHLPPSTVAVDLLPQSHHRSLSEPTHGAPPPPLLHLRAPNLTTLFSSELEYLYTGQGIGAAFEFLFGPPDKLIEEDVDEMGIRKLRTDMVYMWRSRLYSDVRLAVESQVTCDVETTTVIFSGHRFILASRSPYFRSLLLSHRSSARPNEPLTFNLPPEVFTPASLHFTLGYIYTGTLSFSPRTFDLDTAFAIVRSAKYLGMGALCAEIEARIIHEMLHGLFHANLPFEEYDNIADGKWGAGGCRCRQCQRRAARVLHFSLADDIRNKVLERGARRALVAIFGEGWATPEFASLPAKMRASLLKGLINRMTPQNIIPLLLSAHQALTKLGTHKSSWVETIREMILEARKNIDQTLCTRCVESFDQKEWIELLESDGGTFNEVEKIELVMEALRRGINFANGGIVYQTLVSSILLRPHPTKGGETLLSPLSSTRALVEATRKYLITWLRKHWVSVRLASGFDNLDGYTVKEISQELDVSVGELLGHSQAGSSRTGLRRTLAVKTVKTPRSRVELKSPHKASGPPSTRPGALETDARANTPTLTRMFGTKFGRSGTLSTATSGSSLRTTTTFPDSAAALPPTKSVLARKNVHNATTFITPTLVRSTAPSLSSLHSNNSAGRNAGRATPEGGSSATLPQIKRLSTNSHLSTSRRNSRNESPLPQSKDSSRVGTPETYQRKSTTLPTVTPKEGNWDHIIRHGDHRVTSDRGIRLSDHRKDGAGLNPAAADRPVSDIHRSPGVTNRSSTVSNQTIQDQSTPRANYQSLPQKKSAGVTLNVGIPCIISSKRRRFRAFARYMGELNGEYGQWVGVEVPIADGSPADRATDRPWNDGTWGGVRYFEIGAGTDWENDSGRATKRRGFERPTAASNHRKRERRQFASEPGKKVLGAAQGIPGDPKSDLRGLFVRPNQVLFVDAVTHT